MSQARLNSLAGILFVVAMHGAVLYGLWSYHLIPVPEEAVTLFVNLINPPPPAQKKLEPPPPPPPKRVKLVKPHPVTAPPQPILVANAPVISPAEPVAPPPPPMPEPVTEAPPGPPSPEPVPAAPPAPPAPVMLTSDLSLACPQRTPPEYPAMSRRSNEQGRVVLRVELDESGRVISAKVQTGSGFRRLDEAGLAAVKQWNCNAPVRNGEAVRAIALQPFNFVLEGHR